MNAILKAHGYVALERAEQYARELGKKAGFQMHVHKVQGVWIAEPKNIWKGFAS